ncbi:flagellar protein FliS [Sanguibacter gelidistatuariae]|uniref:Flagellar protein FliS n=1 Tax=Sanguibacter gelidistatuariae TaxID=1814289 RepID=A0A1G6PVW8_9MICO|nr:flagellar export chaperone FliS [Sanguibacter gelidistatuariae]SDC84259.1 flagellar protein FliS [Sanguibacter gelidistatuariae]
MSFSTSATQRAQFLNDTVLSASPARLLTMLYDRLVLDIDRAGHAQMTGDHVEANTHLTHAQDIVSELFVTLDVTVWSGGPGLKALYSHLLSELISANLTHDAERTRACRDLVEPLRAAWHEAAASLAPAAPSRPEAPVGAGSRGSVLGVG